MSKHLTADQKNARLMLGGMLAIITLSLGMHVFLVKEGALPTERELAPKPKSQMSTTKPSPYPAKGQRTGEVVAVSFDRFYLQTDGLVLPFGMGDIKTPEVGETITVSYGPGDPPVTLKIDRNLNSSPP